MSIQTTISLNVLWVLAGLLYLLCGLLLSLVYTYNYRTELVPVRLGLISLLWPAVLIVDLVLQIAAGFGSYTKGIKLKLDMVVSKREH